MQEALCPFFNSFIIIHFNLVIPKLWHGSNFLLRNVKIFFFKKSSQTVRGFTKKSTKTHQAKLLSTVTHSGTRLSPTRDITFITEGFP